MDKPSSWIDALARGLRSATPTLVELADPENRWLAVAAVLQQSRSTWLIVPDREVDGTLRELAAHLPEVEVSSVVEPRETGTALIAESWFFETVGRRWLSRVYESLPNAMVVLRGDGFVERARTALTRTVRDKSLVQEVARRVRLGRLLGSTALLPMDLVVELQARAGIPLVNSDPGWVAYLERELGGTALKSQPVEVGPMLRHTFGERTVVVLGQALSVGGSMAFAGDELGLDEPAGVFDEPSPWEDLTLFTPGMPETTSAGWPYAVADAAWRAIRSREGRALVFGSGMNKLAIQQRIRRPLRLMNERGAGVTFAGVDDLERLGTFPLVVVDRLPFPSTLLPSEAVQRHRRLRWFEERACPKAVQTFRRVARLVEPGGTLVVLDHRVRSRAYGDLFTDALTCVHITDWEGFLPAFEGELPGGDQ